jgi:hypothetical protein
MKVGVRVDVSRQAPFVAGIGKFQAGLSAKCAEIAKGILRMPLWPMQIMATHRVRTESPD